MQTSLKTLITAAGVAVMSTSAFAATTTSIEPDLTVGEARGFGGEQIAAGDSLEFRFTAAERLRIEDFFTITGNGSNKGNDLQVATFGYTSPDADTTGTTFADDNIVSFGENAIAFASLPGFVLQEGETFSFFLSNNATSGTIDLDARLSTAAVPVPAAGLLLLTALIGGGAVARRKKTA